MLVNNSIHIKCHHFSSASLCYQVGAKIVLFNRSVRYGFKKRFYSDHWQR